MAQIPATTFYPKHDIHKFRDIRPKLGRDNWISWRRELLATARDRGLYTNILDTDVLPSKNNAKIVTIGGVECIGTTPLKQLIDEWTIRNDTAYNQLLLCISAELQTAIDSTDIASAAWKILTKKFESTDPSKISIVRTRYDNYHMVEGQSVISYLTTMKEYRAQLDKMGEQIANSTHAATILRTLPESWKGISQTIRMITSDPDTIEERLEAHEADLNALEISTQAATTFIAQSRPYRQTTISPSFQNTPPTQFDYYQSNSHQQSAPAPITHCENCGKLGHYSSQCYTSGGR